MATRNNIKVFENVAMTVTSEFVYELSADYNISFQAHWTGLVGEAKFSLFYSLDGLHFDKYPLKELEAGVIYYDIPIVGADESFCFKLNNIGSGFLKFSYSNNTASSGTINGRLNIMDNKHY
jgi:hypothetical protein